MGLRGVVRRCKSGGRRRRHQRCAEQKTYQCFYSLHVFLSFLYRIRSCVLYVKMAAGPFSQRQKISMEQIFTVKYLKNKSLCHYFYTIICVAFFLCLQEIKTIIHISATNVHIKLIRRRTFLNGAVFPCREIHLRGISQMVQRRPPFRVAAEREAAGRYSSRKSPKKSAPKSHGNVEKAAVQMHNCLFLWEMVVYRR